LALSIVSLGLKPNLPFMSESSGIFGAMAGSTGAIQQLSALPTIMCLSGSHSFQEFTILTIKNILRSNKIMA
jgi:hypothetical protein